MSLITVYTLNINPRSVFDHLNNIDLIYLKLLLLLILNIINNIIIIKYIIINKRIAIINLINDNKKKHK